jgi:hypothetical protein
MVLDASGSTLSSPSQSQFVWGLAGVPIRPRPVGMAGLNAVGYLGTFLSASGHRLSINASELLGLATPTVFSLMVADLLTGLNSSVVSRSVTRAPTSVPLVSIPNTVLSRPRASLLVASVTASSCAVSSTSYSFLWSLTPSVAGLSVSALSRKDLSIAAFSLNPGTSYVASLTTTVLESGVAVGSVVATQTFEVLPSDLYVCVRGGDRFVTVDTEVELDGSCSYNPDFPYLNPSFCWRIYNASSSFTPLLTSTVCNFTGSVARIPSFGLLANEVYAVQLLLDVGTARQAASSFIYITTSPPPTHPNPQTFIDSINPAILNNGSSLRLVGRATSPVSTAVLSYVWTEVSAHHLDLSNPVIRSSTIGSANLVVRPSAFLADHTYKFRLTVTDLTKPVGASGGVGIAELSVYVNVAPVGGVCSVTRRADPLNLGNAYTVSCENWQDFNFPLSYQFSWIRDGLTTTLSERSYSSSSDVILPYGSIVVKASIYDAYNALAVSLVPVTVSLPSPNVDLVSLVTNLTRLIDISSDVQGGINLIGATADLLNNGALGSSGSTGGGGADTRQIRDTLIGLISALANSTDTSSQILIQLLTTVTDNPEDISDGGLQNVLTILTNVLDRERGGNTDGSSRVSIGRDVAQTASNVLRSQNCSYTNQVSDLMNDLLSYLNSGMLVDEQGEAINSESINALTQRASLAVSMRDEDGGSIDVPVRSLCFFFCCFFYFLPLLLFLYCLSQMLSNSNETFSVNYIRYRNASVCRTDCSLNRNSVLSDLTTADVLDSNGNARDINGLSSDQSINFSIPLQFPLTPENANLVRCKWYDEISLTWQESGCTTVYDFANPYVVNCRCSHLTDFVVLLSEATAREHTELPDECSAPTSTMSLTRAISFRVFAALYGTVDFVGFFQLSRYYIFSQFLLVFLVSCLLFYLGYCIILAATKA